MGAADVLARHLIPGAQRRVIAGFMARAAKSMMQGEIRRTMVSLGYADRRVTLTEAAATKDLADWATERAAVITRKTNELMTSFVDALPENLSDEQIDGALATFWHGVSAHNEETMLPWQETFLRQRAQRLFYERSGIDAAWSFTPEDGCPDCTAIAAGGPYSSADAAAIDYPHPNCNHSWETALTGDLPDDPWTGGDE